MRTSTYASTVLIVAIQFVFVSAFAQQLAMAPSQTECPSEAPDWIQISWTSTVRGRRLGAGFESGCRIGDWHPDPQDRAVWSGTCSNGSKDGPAVQWFEHNQRIDSFEGTYRGGKREGFGQYVWNEEISFEGQYANDIPNGFGTVNLFGKTFAGD